MKVTPDIIRCELIGTEAEVAKSRHQSYVGIMGKVTDETRNTLVILHQGERKRIIKESAVFRFRFSDGTVVKIDGKLLVGSPDNRLKKRIRRLW
jgi:ribonuclease P protein subunit POP4